MIHNAAFEFVGLSNAAQRLTESGGIRTTEEGGFRICDLPIAAAGAGYPSAFGWAISSGAFDITGDVTITLSNVDVRYEGEWLPEAETYINDEGTWKQVVKIYARRNGVWNIAR